MSIVVKRGYQARGTFPRFFAGLASAIFLAIVSTSAQALFGGYLPLNLSGSVGYHYNYITAGESESEMTMLTGSLNASGFIWQPWFASTSAALNLGISNSETKTSSSDTTNASGSFGLNMFPRSRFPFSLNYSHNDSRLETFSDISRVYDESHYTVSRLTLRQIYEGRATRRSIGSRTYLWYSTTDYNSKTTDSESESLGAQYQIRLVPHNFQASASRSTSKTSNTPNKPKTDVLSITHTYTPGGDLGITNLGTYVDTKDSGSDSQTTLSQLSSNFFWRPEHRALNVNGGVRVSDTESTQGVSDSELKSLNSNLGMSYRLTRHITVGASLSMGSSDSGDSQSLTTSQSGQISYVSSEINFGKFAYNWQGGINGSNSATRTESGATESSTTIQTSGAQLGHSIARRWTLGKNSSLGMNAAQAGNISASSEEDKPSKGFNHSAGLSWNTRGKSGSIYGNVRVSDSRTYASQDSEFQNLTASLSEDWTISRLSFLSGTLSFDLSQQKTVSDVPGASYSSKTRTAAANFSYRHDRPFGIYNLNFTSRLLGNRVIDSFSPRTIWDWDNRLRYSLGLLDTSLSLRIIDASGGEPSKSLYFQATRSF